MFNRIKIDNMKPLPADMVYDHYLSGRKMDIKMLGL